MAGEGEGGVMELTPEQLAVLPDDAREAAREAGRGMDIYRRLVSAARLRFPVDAYRPPRIAVCDSRSLQCTVGEFIDGHRPGDLEYKRRFVTSVVDRYKAPHVPEISGWGFVKLAHSDVLVIWLSDEQRQIWNPILDVVGPAWAPMEQERLNRCRRSACGLWREAARE